MTPYSVVVVARDQTRQLLGTLLALRKYAQPHEVLLIDNASGSNLRPIAGLSQLPLRHLRLPEHVSLGAAFNAGLDAAANDLVLLLHGDVLIETDPAVAVAFLDRHRDTGIAGGKLLQSGDPPRRVMHAGYRVARGRVGPRAIGHLEWDRYHDSTEVVAVSTACAVVRRTTVRFDERFWFSLEDVDLCHQYRQHGFSVVFLPELRAIHLVNGGVRENRTGLAWAARELATRWLYHDRWCSDLPLEHHPIQIPVRGEPARAHLQRVDDGLIGLLSPVASTA
jgi:GT2 family glycosyltransferase